MKRILTVVFTVVFCFAIAAGCAAEPSFAEPDTGDAAMSAQPVQEGSEAPQSAKDDPALAEWPAYSQAAIVDGKSEEPLRFAFLGYANNSFWNTVQEGVEKATEVLKDYNVEIENITIGSDITAVNFNNAVDACIVDGYDGIVGVPLVDGTEVGMNKAVEAGIPFFAMCGEPVNPAVEMKRQMFIGSNPDVMGENIGKSVVKWLKEEGVEGSVTYGVIEAYLGSTEDVQVDAFRSVLAESYPESVEVGPYESQDQAEQVYSYAKDMLTAYPDLKFIYVTGGGPTGAARAIQELGLTGKVGVFYHDDTEENLAYVKSGECIALASQGAQQQAFDSFVHLYHYVLTGELPEGLDENGKMASNMEIIDAGNIDEHWKG